MLMKNSTSPSTVNAIAGFADRAVSTSLKPDARKLYKRNILDSLGCAIAALPGAPFAALREQFAEYRSGGSCSLIGGGKTAPDQAALFNSGLVRYVDLLDSYMSPGGLCHPGDNFGTILAAAEHARASGEEFMLALAIAFEIQCRFTAMVLSWQRVSITRSSLRSRLPPARESCLDCRKNRSRMRYRSQLSTTSRSLASM
jgi:2-methylcitrate dehydratase